MANGKSVVFKLLLGLSFIIVTLFSSTAGADRTTDGLLVLYKFDEGSSTTVKDTSPLLPAMDLTIQDGSAVSWLPGGGLSINSTTMITSAGAATKVINAVKATNQITVEVWIKPANLTQGGPARIITISQDGANRNFTLGQNEWDGTLQTFQLRLRSTDSSSSTNGAPYLFAPENTATMNLTHVVCTRDSSGNRIIYVDGVAVANQVVGGDLSNWADYSLAIGNEFASPTDQRDWQGEIHLAAIYDRDLSAGEVMDNFSAGAHPSNPEPTASGDALLVDETGRVGIGTATPASKLHIVSEANDVASIPNANLYLRGSNQGYGVAMGTRYTYPSGAWLQGMLNDAVGPVNILLNPTDGNVGIGTANPQDKLDVNGNVRANGSLLTSDERWKENVELLNNALDRVVELRGVTFEWVDPSRGQGRQIGVIAQEIEQVYPELVHTDSQGYKSVEYAKLVAPLIEAVKTLKNDNVSLKRENLILKQLIEDIHNRLKLLEENK